MSVMFTTELDEKFNYFVDYGYSAEKFTYQIDAKYHTYNAGSSYTRVVYEAILQNLILDSKIYYRIGSKENPGVYSKIFFFHNFDDSKLTSFKFLVGGDGTNEKYDEILSHLNKTRMEDVNLMLFPGDFSFSKIHETGWDVYGERSEVLNAYLPVITAVGNHESSHSFTSYLNRFSRVIGDNSGSKSQLYFSFNFAFVHFITLSSEHPYDSESIQYKWLENDLKSIDREKTPMVFVQYHRPMYSSNIAHMSDTNLRKELETLFRDYKVIVAFNGHVHAYERTCDVYQEVCQELEPDISLYHFTGFGTIHSYIGSMGRKVYPLFEPEPEWSYKRFAKYGYSLYEVSIDPEPKVESKFYEVHSLESETIEDEFIITFIKDCKGKYSFDLDYVRCTKWDSFIGELNRNSNYYYILLVVFAIICFGTMIVFTACNFYFVKKNVQHLKKYFV